MHLPRAAALALFPAVALVLLQAPAAAGKAQTFTGTCQLSGTVRFEPALTNSPQTVTQVVRATGTCSGAPATYVASELAPRATCGGGTDTGSGQLALRGGKIGFTISEVRAGPVVTATANGEAGGSAAGQGNISPGASPVSVVQACGGTGLSEAPIDIRLASPSISG